MDPLNRRDFAHKLAGVAAGAVAAPLVSAAAQSSGTTPQSKGGKKIICAFGTDVDSVAGQIGSYAGGDSPSDIQRGIFASEVGTIRLLNLFKKYIK